MFIERNIMLGTLSHRAKRAKRELKSLVISAIFVLCETTDLTSDYLPFKN